MNIFTILALKSKRVKLLSSAWRHFENFFLLFLMITSFHMFFSVVYSQISHIGETIFLSKMVFNLNKDLRTIWKDIGQIFTQVQTVAKGTIYCTYRLTDGSTDETIYHCRPTFLITSEAVAAANHVYL